MLPVSSSSRAIVRWIRPRKPGSTRTSPTVACAGHDRAVLDPAEVAELAHLAQVVVAARQVEQQVADRVEVEPDPGPPKRRRRRPARTRASGVDSSSTGSVGTGADARRLGHAYSAAIRYR